jgi:hypothetical protein
VGTELQLSLGIATLRVELAEFVAVTKSLAGAATGSGAREEFRTALREMISEATKSYETFDSTLTPLWEMDTARKFSNRFAQVRAAIKSKRRTQGNVIRTHCSIVEAKMEVMRGRRSWMARVPAARRSFQRLEQLGSDWLFVDQRLVWEMESFLDSLDRFLREVQTLKQRRPAEGFSTLQAGLEQIDGDYRAIGRMLAELRVVSSEL